jgi:hypothetical protein
VGVGGALLKQKENYWNILWALTLGFFWKQKANHQTARFVAKIHQIIIAYRTLLRSHNSHTIL